MAIGNFTLCCLAPDSSSYFSTGNLVFARMNLKPAVLKNFVFDWELCFHFCEVYRFQNLVGLELPIKHSKIGKLYLTPGTVQILHHSYLRDFLQIQSFDHVSTAIFLLHIWLTSNHDMRQMHLSLLRDMQLVRKLEVKLHFVIISNSKYFINLLRPKRQTSGLEVTASLNVQH